MKYIFNSFLYFTILLVSGFLVSGCTTKQGLYEGGLVEGWKREVAGGDTYFYFPPTARKGGLYDFVQFGTAEENILHIQTSFVHRSVIFADGPIRVIPLDGEPSKDFALPRNFGNFQKYILIDLPETRNFKIEFPPITLDGQEMPPLTVEFKWSDRKYMVFFADPP